MVKRINKSIVVVLLALVSCGAPYGVSEYRPSKPTQNELEWETGLKLERMGNLSAAAARYGALCRGTARYIRGCYDECRVLFESGMQEEARQCALTFIEQNPEHGLAPVMVRTLSSDYRQASHYDEGAGKMGELASTVVGSDVWDSIIFERAKLFRAEQMILDEELDLRRLVDQGRWGSQLWDDALWRLIQIKQDSGDMRAEENLLKEMLQAREKSRLVASYNSPWFDDAMLRLGKLYQLKGELEKAYKTFMALSEWKTSRLRDDAMMQCAILKKEQGNIPQACGHLSTILTVLPKSDSARHAGELQRQWGCLRNDNVNN